MMRKAAGVLGLVLIVSIFVWAAKQQGKMVNKNIKATDQMAYLYYAKNMARTDLQFVGGRNRMPIYPALMSFFYKEGMPDKDFFERGKNIGIALSLIGLTIVFLVLSRVSRPWDALTATLVVMFTVFVYKAPYFQAEVLFYVISLVLFYFLLDFVKKPTFRAAALAGFAGAVGYLTKASVLPALFLAGFFVLVQGGLCLRGKGQKGVIQSFELTLKPLLLILVFICCFLMLVSPYILTSKERFGKYFYNVNSTFYVWYDSWKEVKQGTRAHGDRKGWPEMPAEQIPSFGKYIRDHSPGEILSRVSKGLIVVGSKAFQYSELLLVYLAMALVLFVQNRAFLVEQLFRRKYSAVFLFVAAYFISYVLLYAWYSPISSGNRFILSLFLPAIFILAGFISCVREKQLRFNCFGKKVSASMASPVVLVFLFAYILFVLPFRITVFYGGS